MTPAELEAERRYIISERLGILSDDREPSPEQLAIAEREAEAWVQRQRMFDENGEGKLL